MALTLFLFHATVSKVPGTHSRAPDKRKFRTMRVSTWEKVAAGVLMSALAACGGDNGGGGGYGSSMPTPTMPAPTVSFSQPGAAASINFGEALSVTWTSTNATSCSATTSSAAGGAFSGSQAMSGTQSLVPTASGNYTY